MIGLGYYGLQSQRTRYKVTMRETAMVGLKVALPSAPLGPRSSERIHGI